MCTFCNIKFNITHWKLVKESTLKDSQIKYFFIRENIVSFRYVFLYPWILIDTYFTLPERVFCSHMQCTLEVFFLELEQNLTVCQIIHGKVRQLQSVTKVINKNFVRAIEGCIRDEANHPVLINRLFTFLRSHFLTVCNLSFKIELCARMNVCAWV